MFVVLNYIQVRGVPIVFSTCPSTSEPIDIPHSGGLIPSGIDEMERRSMCLKSEFFI